MSQNQSSTAYDAEFAIAPSSTPSVSSPVPRGAYPSSQELESSGYIDSSSIRSSHHICHTDNSVDNRIDNSVTNANIKSFGNRLEIANHGHLNLHLLETMASNSHTPGAVVKFSFDIPFRLNAQSRNIQFTGREYLLSEIHGNIDAGRGRFNFLVLYGSAGMGKTQLALEYVYTHYSEYSSVFWINATSEQTTILGLSLIMQQVIEHHISLSDSSDYSQLSRLLSIQLDSMGRCTGDQSSMVSAVMKWLTAAGNSNWLLVYDNVDDLESFSIHSYIPSCGHGTIIATSRRPEFALRRKGVNVQEMQEMEAVALLLNSANIVPETLTLEGKDDAVLIARELGYWPLAIEQAGAYICTHQISLHRYLQTYRANPPRVLSKDWTLGEYKHSVFATLELSFQAVQKQRPEAAELLLLCGFLGNDDIWEELIHYAYWSKEASSNISWPAQAMSYLWGLFGLTRQQPTCSDPDENIRVLLSYSLIKRKQSDDSFTIHPLVHSWARRRLDLEPRKQEIKMKQALLTVASKFSNSNTRSIEDWMVERRIMSHIEVLIKHVGKYILHPDHETIWAVNNLGRVFLYQGRYPEAQETLKLGLTWREKLLGKEHPDTIFTVNNIAMLFNKQGQYEKALEWYGRALAGREKALPKEHPDILSIVHSMAVVMNKQGQYQKALDWYWRALAGREKSLGKEHPETIYTVHSMAVVFDNQGQYEKALEWYGRALAVREESLGREHPDTLTTVHSMAVTFDNQGHYAKALEWYRRALAGREKSLGKEHPYTLATVHGMAAVFHKQGHYEKALEWYRRALVVKEKSLSKEHPHILWTVNNIATVFYKQGHYEKALEWYGRALYGREKSLGKEHPYTVATVHGMAAVFHKQAQYEKALEWYDRALVGREKSLGKEHPDTLTTVHDMAAVFDSQGLHGKALEWYRRALCGREKALGMEHPDTVDTVRCMAAVGNS